MSSSRSISATNNSRRDFITNTGKAACGVGPVILSSACTNCGRRIDKRVFKFSTRYSNSQSTPETSTALGKSPVGVDGSFPKATKTEPGS
ncbi:MAG: hypothetical protein KUG53_02895 [Pseudomonadales bacterium]|nr:hypothetical protein [Pseudomonadales bacterium]